MAHEQLLVVYASEHLVVSYLIRIRQVHILLHTEGHKAVIGSILVVLMIVGAR